SHPKPGSGERLPANYATAAPGPTTRVTAPPAGAAQTTGAPGAQGSSGVQGGAGGTLNSRFADPNASAWRAMKPTTGIQPTPRLRPAENAVAPDVTVALPTPSEQATHTDPVLWSVGAWLGANPQSFEGIENTSDEETPTTPRVVARQAPPAPETTLPANTAEAPVETASAAPEALEAAPEPEAVSPQKVIAEAADVAAPADEQEPSGAIIQTEPPAMQSVEADAPQAVESVEQGEAAPEPTNIAQTLEDNAEAAPITDTVMSASGDETASSPVVETVETTPGASGEAAEGGAENEPDAPAIEAPVVVPTLTPSDSPAAPSSEGANFAPPVIDNVTLDTSGN
ncbi:MAG TPA: hypothetical protein VKQ36_03610, partial [Ktedonobacterales bacterium]|nr:hypothetical protein [Ktedonobacterales bacterium]